MWNLSEELDNYEMAELSKSYYGDAADISFVEFLKWQYDQNPNGKVLGYVARNEDGNVVGQYLVIPIELCFHNNIIRGSYSLNTLTHPGYNGQGIFTSLAKATFDKCRDKDIFFTYAFPNPNSYYGFINKLGFINLGSPSFFLKPYDFKELLSTKLKSKSITSFLGSMMKPARLAFRTRIKLDMNIKIKEIFSFDSIYEEFWGKYKTYHKIILNRTTNYMNWRYFEVPQRNYRVFMASNGEKPVSYIIIRTSVSKGIKTGLIADFMLERSNMGEAGGYSLLVEAEKIFTQEKVSIIGCLMKKNTEQAKILKKMGFIICPSILLPQPVPFVLKDHLQQGDSSLSQMFKIDDWFLTLGDYDVG